MISFISFSQNFVGTYYQKIEPSNADFFEYELHLKNNFTYQITIQRSISKNIEVEHFKGQGTWKQEKHKILFYPELCGEKNEIDMTTVTARFDIKKKDELLFYSKKKMGWGLNVGMKRK